MLLQKLNTNQLRLYRVVLGLVGGYFFTASFMFFVGALLVLLGIGSGEANSLTLILAIFVYVYICVHSAYSQKVVVTSLVLLVSSAIMYFGAPYLL